MTDSGPEARKGLLAIVPARLGSKRLPGKNLLPLGNKPLIQWTLDAAIESAVFDYIAVSSEDPAILQQLGCAGVIQISRPAELATDSATTVDVALHVLDELELQNIRPARLMLLQPTSPLRSAGDIRAAVDLMASRRSNSVISVCLAEHSPLWCGTLKNDLSMQDFLKPSLQDKRSQDLPQFYRLNGAIYLTTVETFVKEKTFFTQNSHAYIMAADRSIDIDTREDFLFAEFLCERRS